MYALLTGSRFISFAYNAMCNIWYAYDTRGLNTTPHTALISAYLAHHLPPQIHRGRIFSFATYQIKPTAKSMKNIEFRQHLGSYTLSDTSRRPPRVYVAPRDDQEGEHVGQDPQGGEQPGWFTAYAQERRAFEQQLSHH